MRLGVLSDTHGFLDPRIPELFAGVTHILHAGDVGPAGVLLELLALAPVTAVRGNTDAGLDLPQTASVELAGRKFLVHHIVNPQQPSPELRARLVREAPNVVVFGHTHQPFCQTVDGTLYFNPGYAGKPKFGHRRTVALLHCNTTEITPQFLSLD